MGLVGSRRRPYLRPHQRLSPTLASLCAPKGAKKQRQRAYRPPDGSPAAFRKRCRRGAAPPRPRRPGSPSPSWRRRAAPLLRSRASAPFCPAPAAPRGAGWPSACCWPRRTSRRLGRLERQTHPSPRRGASSATSWTDSIAFTRPSPRGSRTAHPPRRRTAIFLRGTHRGVTDMSELFYRASFNEDIMRVGHLVLQHGERRRCSRTTFYYASAFNQDILRVDDQPSLVLFGL